MDSDPKPRAVILTPEVPYPLASGGSLRTASLLHGLARSYQLDLIVFRQPGAPDPRILLPCGLANRVSIIDLPANGRNFTARAFRNAIRVVRQIPPLMDRFSGFERQVAAALQGERYDLGVIEHFWCAPYWEQLSASCLITVLDLHNIESVLHERCAETETGATRFVHRVFAKAAAGLELDWLPRFSRILTASSSDRALVLARAPKAWVTVFPNAVALPLLPTCERRHAIVFSGNLEYHPNVSAVRFFREEVWPRLRDCWPGLVWRLVGSNPSAVEPWTKGDPRIEVTGPVEDAYRELARAEVAVVPLLAGSGTRFKILEAWAAGLPVVSTTLGAEGLPARHGHHLLIADTAESFAASVSKLLNDTTLRCELGRAGRSLVESEFTWEKAWASLDL